MTKRMITFIFSVIFLFTNIFAVNVYAEGEETEVLDISAVSAVIMEASTGQIIYEKNPHERLRPASVTKIMTLLLIYDAIANGSIKWDEEVVVSEHAASMGGSQVYLEANEIQTVEIMTKCIAVASGNDAAVAMAEFVAGTESVFVDMMNERAAELGMVDTHFVNPSGLDDDNHYTSAYDIALMSRELTTKYPEVFDFTTIWMDTIIHKTARGEEEFGLTNTNKLLQWYEGTTGLKTGSTTKAKYCLSGTATRNGLDLIAVVMAAPDYKTRFREVMTMLDYGFAVCRKYEDKIKDTVIDTLEVKKGQLDNADVIALEDFGMILTKKDFDESKMTKQIILPETLEAPIVENQKVGEIIYTYDGVEMGRVDLLAKQEIPFADFKFYLKKIYLKYFR